MASLKTGRYATPATLGTWVGMHPSLAERVDRYRADRQKLRDLDELLARVWAVTDILSETKPDAILTAGGMAPPPVLAALRALADTLEKCSRIEVRLRAADLGLLESRAIGGLFRAAIEVFRRYLPSESVGEAVLELGRIADAKYHLETLVERWGGEDPAVPDSPVI